MSFAAGLALLACLGSPAATQTSVSTAAPRIERVLIERKNVFDLSVPGEDWWPFRLANRIHIQTRDPVIRHEILLPPGEPWDPLKALESERNLRNLGFIRHAEVNPSSSAAR